MENSYLKKYKEEQLRSCQLKQLEILKVFDAICKKHNLRYWIDGGTLLGAVRHGGFIPWDDDLDVAMPSEDYKKFNEIAQKELPKELFWQTEKTDPSMRQGCGKIRDLNSFYVEFGDDFTRSYQKGLFIDVFEMVYYPSIPRKLVNIILGKISRSKAILSKKRYLDFRSIVEIPYFLSLFCLLWPIWKMVSWKRDRNVLSYTPFFNTKGWVFSSSDIFPLKKIEFEKIKFSAPKNSEKVLSELYGNYMELPPVEERQVHAIFIQSTLI